MDDRIRARFYQVEEIQEGDAGLYECLHRLWAHQDREDYHEVFGGIWVRLERFDSDGGQPGSGFVDGELTRQQNDNIPPIAEQGRPLEGFDRPLGHRCAFRYHAETRTLLLESRPNGVTPIRMDGLVKHLLRPHRGFFLSPTLTENALRRLVEGTPRRVSFRVATPSDMASVEQSDRTIEENLTNMANTFGGQSIEVSVGFPRGQNDSFLNMGAIRRSIEWATGNRDHVVSYRVKISEEPEPIDIFTEQIKISEDAPGISNLDVDVNYDTRRRILREAFNTYLPVIRRTYT
ncbi:hypothetical protein [Roseobacter sp. S98]|uniref:hypothetical protein n=1 Tax=Roseobacter algicola (ex Choi et al. 2025) (nom. illeg.) TaxID=3092138 RepID=UPI0035C6E2B8